MLFSALAAAVDERDTIDFLEQSFEQCKNIDSQHGFCEQISIGINRAVAIPSFISRRKSRTVPAQ